MDYLGPTRADIAREKAGIFRAGRPVVCAEPDPPSTLTDHARAIGAPVTQIGRDFGYVAGDRQWQYWGPGGDRFGLPYPALRGAYQLANAATVLAAIGLMQDRLHVPAGAVRDGLCAVRLQGRFQVLPGKPAIVLDVAHNPHAARVLAATLGTMGFFPATIAVFGMLADKDVHGVIDAVKARIDRWFVATLPGPRGAAADAIRARLEEAGVARSAIRMFDDIDAAIRRGARGSGRS